MGEITKVVGSGRQLEYEHLSRLSYVNAVVDETLRLHPPAIWTNREIQGRDLDLDGTKIPQGTMVFVPTVAVHRSKLNWDDPDEFRPERFLQRPEEGSFVPFGAGRRVCPGYRLAPFELRVCLATFALRGLKVMRQPDDPKPVIRANGAFQLCLKNHLRLSV